MKRFKNILFVIEPEAWDGSAFDRVVTLTEDNQAHLTLVVPLERIPDNDRIAVSGISAQALHCTMVDMHQQQLDEWITPVRSKIDVQAKVLIGTPFLTVIHEVLRNGRDLVVKTLSKAKGILHQLLRFE